MECVIVGGGPVGCLMASLLVSRGLQCVVYEKRSDPRTLKDAGKSINLALSCRGLTALALLGDDQKLLRALQEAVPMPGRYIHTLNGEDNYQPYSNDPKEYLHSVNRRDLNNDLCTISEKRGVKMIFDHPIERIDFEDKIAHFRNTKTNEIASTLWGADGSNSRVRKELERVSGVPSKTERFESGYKEFEVLPLDGTKFKVQEAFHVWPRQSPTFFIALPNADATYTCTLFNPAEGSDHIMNWRDEDVVDLFRTQFPDAYAAMGAEKILADHRANPFGGLYNVDAPVWNHVGDVVILGDAAHGVVPYLGLGINSGFEGCRHLLNLMDKYKKEDGSYDWKKVFEQFNKYKLSTDALRDAAVENAYEAVGDVHFLFEKEVERILQKKYPNNFIESHALLSFTNVPIVDCGKRMKLQREITVELCAGKSSIDEVDWTRADALITEKLGEDLFSIKNWYEV